MDEEDGRINVFKFKFVLLFFFGYPLRISFFWFWSLPPCDSSSTLSNQRRLSHQQLSRHPPLATHMFFVTDEDGKDEKQNVYNL